MKGKTKKKFKSNRANSTNLRSRIWDHDNLIKEKKYKNHEAEGPTTLCWKIQMKEKSIIKKT